MPDCNAREWPARARSLGRRALTGGRWASILLIALVTWPCKGLASGTRTASIDLLLGTAVNFRTPLTVRQEGRPEIEFGAEYSTRPLTSPVYYALRVALERRGGGWELEFVHHKLHLSNAPEEIQHFEITHGFNIFSLNRALDVKGGTFRVGAGMILAHPESRIRDLSGPGGGILDTGYFLTGPALLLGVGREFPLSHRLYVAADVQLIAARVRVPVAEGTASAPSVGLHFLIGFGRRL